MYVGLEGAVTRKEVREAFRNGLTREQYLARRTEIRGTEQPSAKGTYRDGVDMMLVDPALHESLMEIAALSLALIEYTEKGGAGSFRPNEFEMLMSKLVGLGPLLQTEGGTGQLVSGLITLMESLED